MFVVSGRILEQTSACITEPLLQLALDRNNGEMILLSAVGIKMDSCIARTVFARFEIISAGFARLEAFLVSDPKSTESFVSG